MGIRVRKRRLKGSLFTEDTDELVIDTAGLPGDVEMYFDPASSQCGNIKDGISFALSGFFGWWVISFEDFEQMYRAAVARRDVRPAAGADKP